MASLSSRGSNSILLNTKFSCHPPSNTSFFGAVFPALAPSLIFPACSLSYLASITLKCLVRSARVHISVVVCFLSVIVVCSILISTLFFLSNSSVNTVFAPWNPVWFSVWFWFLRNFLCTFVNCNWEFSHILSPLGRLSHFSQSSVSTPVW